MYAVHNRAAEPVLEFCKAHGIASIPWFPIGGGSLKGDEALQSVDAAHDVGIPEVALA